MLVRGTGGHWAEGVIGAPDAGDAREFCTTAQSVLLAKVCVCAAFPQPGWEIVWRSLGAVGARKAVNGRRVL